MFGILIAHPLLALLLALFFLAVYRGTRSRAVLACSGVWALYGLYEAGMKYRVLCSGECNIRIDLLLIYPLLIILSIYSVADGFRARRSPGA